MAKTCLALPAVARKNETKCCDDADYLKDHTLFTDTFKRYICLLFTNVDITDITTLVRHISLFYIILHPTLRHISVL